jgi:hypothetical protein
MLVLAIGAAGCASRVPRAAEPGRAPDARAPSPDERLAAAEGDPLSAPLLAEAGRALRAAGRAGEAHAALLAAAFLAEHPTEGRPAFPRAYARDLAREAGAAGRAPAVEEDPAPGRESAARRRAREEALRRYAAKDVSGALARLGEVPGAERDARLARVIASCDLQLAAEAARAGDEGRAIALLWSAVNVEPSVRSEAIYREIARLERRRALAAAARNRGEEARAALLRALRAAPGEPETLYLLGRSAPVPARPEVAAWARRTLAACHPDAPEARFFDAAARVRAAAGVKEASEIAEAFEAANPRARGQAADLWSLVAERAGTDAAREAHDALVRYDEAREAAARSREELESALGAGAR